MTQNRCFVYCY